MKKNVASQVVGAQLNSRTDGSPVTTGTTTVLVTGDGGTQTTGSVGSGAATHEGNGFWTYNPSQAETNFDHVAFTFTNTTAVYATVQIYTSFPQTGDSFARLGAPAGASVAADLAAVQADTDNIQTRLPAALVGGRMDASVGAMEANVLTATAIAADAITDAKVASDVTIASVTGSVGSVTGSVGSVTGAVGSVTGNVGGNVTGSVGSVTGNVGGNVTGSVGSVATGGITSGSFAAGAINAAAIATGAIDADAVAADAVTEIQAGLATSAALATVDTVVDAIKVTTDKLDTALELDGAVYRYTTNALEQAPTGGSAPTAAQIADAVWDEMIADHLTAGSTGNALNNATAAGNPWEAVLEGSYTAGDLQRAIAGYCAGKTSIVQNGTRDHNFTFRNVSDTGDIIESQVVNGERTSVTVTP